MLKIFIVIMTALFIFAGCSAETAKRTAYETLQNIRDQECSRTPSVDCEKRESLEVYEDKQQGL